MSEQSKKRFVKVGAVLKKVDKPGVFLITGDSNNKNEQYRTTVEITVKNAKGEVLAQSSNGLLTILDPRKRKGLSEEQLAKIPDRLHSEVFIVVDEEGK